MCAGNAALPGRTFFIVLGVAIAFALVNFLLSISPPMVVHRRSQDQQDQQDGVVLVIIAGLFFLLTLRTCGIGIIFEFVIGSLVWILLFMAPALLWKALVPATLLHNPLHLPNTIQIT